MSDTSRVSQYGMTQLSDGGPQRILKHFSLHFKTMQHVLERLRSGDKQKRKGHGSAQDEKLLPLPNSQHLFVLRSFATPRLQACFLAYDCYIWRVEQ